MLTPSLLLVVECQTYGVGDGDTGWMLSPGPPRPVSVSSLPTFSSRAHQSGDSQGQTRVSLVCCCPLPPQLIPGVGGDVLNTRTQRAQSMQHTPSRAQCQCGEPERNS